MAEFVLNAAQVGDVVTYVAPGFLAQLGYRMRFPAQERSAGHTLIISVVLSLPLVAAADALIEGSHVATRLGYALALTVGSFVLGYALACIRAHPWVKSILGWLQYRSPPEGSIYAQTLKHMSAAAPVTVEFKDGRRLNGTPRSGPEFKDDGISELYLTHPEARTDGGEWVPVGAGVIVPLSEISNIVLSEDPTGAPTVADADGI
jgi:hypothetical protein